MKICLEICLRSDILREISSPIRSFLGIVELYDRVPHMDGIHATTEREVLL